MEFPKLLSRFVNCSRLPPRIIQDPDLTVFESLQKPRQARLLRLRRFPILGHFLQAFFHLRGALFANHRSQRGSLSCSGTVGPWPGVEHGAASRRISPCLLASWLFYIEGGIA